MSAFQDIFEIVFAARGVTSVVAGFQAQQNAATAMTAAVTRLNQAQAGGNQKQINSAQQSLYALQLQQTNAAQAAAAAHGTQQAGAAITFLREEISIVREAIQAYEDYASQVRTIQQITGATTRQAEQFENLAKIGGVSNLSSTLEVIRLANDFKTTKGQGALRTLGIDPKADPNSLATLNKVLAAFRAMPDGVKKTSLEIDLFSMRGVRALQPFLNIFPDIAERANALNANLEGGALQAITHLQQNTALLGQTFLVDFVIPIVQKIIPAIDWFITAVEGMILAWHNFDETLGGLPSWVVAIGAMGAGMAAIIVAVNSAVTAFGAMKAAIQGAAAAQVILDLLEGPAGWAVLGAAGIAAGLGAMYYFHNNSQEDAKAPGGEGLKDAASTMKEAASTFSDAVNNIRSWQSAAPGQIPDNLSPQAYAFLLEQRAQGAVG